MATRMADWRKSRKLPKCSYQIIGPTLRLLPIGQVSATLRELDPSILTYIYPLRYLLENGNIQITGQILPCTQTKTSVYTAEVMVALVY